MPKRKTYDLFVSHSWYYSAGYNRLFEHLDAANNFRYRSHSLPQHDPTIDPKSDAGKTALASALDAQIRPVTIVLVLAGQYLAYNYWIQKQIDMARSYGKPVLRVNPVGAGKNTCSSGGSGCGDDPLGYSIDCKGDPHLCPVTNINDG